MNGLRNKSVNNSILLFNSSSYFVMCIVTGKSHNSVDEHLKHFLDSLLTRFNIIAFNTS
jgi:hypothetical protein